MLRPGSILPELTLTHVVSENDLAPHVAATGTGAGPERNVFPRVLGTAQLIAWMELAAAKAMEPMLLPGELTAGIVVRIEHHAPTPLAGTVRMTARYLGTEGKFYRFEVVAHDDAGEIFRGQHIRAVVEAARLEKGAARRLRK
ncbi:MAG TPA: thioesterase [Pseudomonadota bacterium]|jgi:predicted thioesterase|nr:thioesterase [Pseudomonadota bacterium]